jgi:hypothetical protein
MNISTGLVPQTATDYSIIQLAPQSHGTTTGGNKFNDLSKTNMQMQCSNVQARTPVDESINQMESLQVPLRVQPTGS